MLFLAGVCRAADVTQPLTLRTCYDLALAHSESLGIAAAEWQAAEARYHQTQDSLVPSISLLASDQLQNDRRGGAGSTSGNRDPQQANATIHAQQTLYSGFRITHVAEAREAEGRAAKLDETRLRETLYLDVADAFYQTVLYERQLAVLGEISDVLSNTVVELEKRLQVGRSRRADVLSAITDLAEARVLQETLHGQLGAARELLAFLVDVPSEKIQLAETSPFPSDPHVEEMLARAVERSDVQAGQARVEAAQGDLKAAKSDRQPQVNAGGDVFLYEDPDQDRQWNIVLTFELPLFDEGVIRSHVAENAANYQVSQLNLAALRRRAGTEVRNAYIAFTATAAQRARLQEAIQSAQEHYDVQKKDYEMGRASQLDSLDALAQLLRLRQSEVAAEMQARVSLVRLHVAAGETAP